jgi:hypothetical protein
MKGKAKLERKPDGRYYVFVRNHFWQKWVPLVDSGKQVSFETMEEFGKVTKIECFDRITIKFDKFSGLER